jgi:hypothetical protein
MALYAAGTYSASVLFEMMYVDVIPVPKALGIDMAIQDAI